MIGVKINKLQKIKYIFRKTKNNQQGFSLFEMLVAITIFILLMLTATDIFQMMLKAQSKFISEQATQESMRFALEMMSKEIRFAKKSNGSCDPGNLYPNNRIFTTTESPAPAYWSDLFFKNKNGDCVQYYLDNNRLKIKRIDSLGNPTVNLNVTPDEIKIENLKFAVIDNLVTALPGSLKQPLVTVSMDVTAPGSRTIKLQTTISSRNYDY